MRAKINNFFYIFHRWTDRSKFGALVKLLIILAPFIFLMNALDQYLSQTGYLIQLIIGILFFIQFIIYFISRQYHNNYKLVFDKSVLPDLLGETIIITKHFFFANEQQKYFPGTNIPFTLTHRNLPKVYLNYPESIDIVGEVVELRKGEDFKVIDIIELKDDILFTVLDPVNNSKICDISYRQSKKYWVTKEKYRSDKLKKIGI